MNAAQRQVQDFMQEAIIHGGQQLISATPELVDTELRLSLIREEVGELEQAVADNNLVEAIDALCDLLYVTYGAACTWGIDIEPFFDEVHRSNMAKFGPGFSVREDGKYIKPSDWQPPNLKLILDTHPSRLELTVKEVDLLNYLSTNQASVIDDFNPRVGAYRRDNGERIPFELLERLVTAGLIEEHRGFSGRAWTLKETVTVDP